MKMYLVASSYMDHTGDTVEFTTRGKAYSAQQAVDRNRETYGDQLFNFKVVSVWEETTEEWKDNGQTENTD